MPNFSEISPLNIDIVSREKWLTNNGRPYGQTDNPKMWCFPPTVGRGIQSGPKSKLLYNGGL